MSLIQLPVVLRPTLTPPVFEKARAFQTYVPSLVDRFIGGPQLACLQPATLEDVRAFVSILRAKEQSCTRQTIHQTLRVKIILPDGLVQVPLRLFRDLHSLVSVELPHTVREIGVEAFAGCEYLRSVLLRAGLKHIYKGAFAGCSSLQELYLPGTLESIGIEAFWYSGLKKIYLPDSVRRVWPRAFGKCFKLLSIRFPRVLQRIEEHVIAECVRLHDVTLPQTLYYIDKEAFWNCHKITHLDFPETLICVDTRAFANCTELCHVSMPICDTWGRDVFTGCSKLHLRLNGVTVEDFYINLII